MCARSWSAVFCSSFCSKSSSKMSRRYRRSYQSLISILASNWLRSSFAFRQAPSALAIATNPSWYPPLVFSLLIKVVAVKQSELALYIWGFFTGRVCRAESNHVVLIFLFFFFSLGQIMCWAKPCLSETTSIGVQCVHGFRWHVVNNNQTVTTPFLSTTRLHNSHKTSGMIHSNLTLGFI